MANSAAPIAHKQRVVVRATSPHIHTATGEVPAHVRGWRCAVHQLHPTPSATIPHEMSGLEVAAISLTVVEQILKLGFLTTELVRTAKDFDEARRALPRPAGAANRMLAIS